MKDHIFDSFTAVITHLGCWQKTRKACKSRAELLRSLSLMLPTSRPQIRYSRFTRAWCQAPVTLHWELTTLKLVENSQHSLTSVERPSYLRSDFVNLWRHARLEVFNTLKYVIHLHLDRLYPTCLIFGERFCPTFWIIPRLIPINSNKKMPLPPFKGCFDVSSLFLLRGEKDLSVDVTE